MPKVKPVKKSLVEGAEICTVSGVSIHASGKSTRGTVTAKPLDKAAPGVTLQEVVARVREDGTWSMALLPGKYQFMLAGSQYVVAIPALNDITFDDLVEKHSVLSE